MAGEDVSKNNRLCPVLAFKCLFNLARHPMMVGALQDAIGPNVLLILYGVWFKWPGTDTFVSWHQDGITHWESPNWDQGSHGFNFMGQLYGCTPANGVWVVPGSHKVGRIDIKAKVAGAGTERLPDAVPMVCKPGDLVISNRQLLHGSFANTSEDWRVTVIVGLFVTTRIFGNLFGFL
mgnify:CR=1 FL=1